MTVRELREVLHKSYVGEFRVTLDFAGEEYDITDNDNTLKLFGDYVVDAVTAPEVSAFNIFLKTEYIREPQQVCPRLEVLK